jgi:hypothetical protein
METGTGRDTKGARTMIRELLTRLDKRFGRSKKKMILRPRRYGNKHR